MTYCVLCTFDLKNASSTDYQRAYSELESIGLHRAQANSGGGKTVIPTTTVLGSYTGANSAAIRDDVREKIRKAFRAQGFEFEFFLVIGGQDWTWGAQAS